MYGRLEELSVTRVYYPTSSVKTLTGNAETQGGVYALARAIELIETLVEQVKKEEVNVGDNDEQERDIPVR